VEGLVIFESMYGNTAHIAQAIGRGLQEHGMATRVVGVGDVEPESVDVDLLVVGGPTHAHGMSREATRTTARKDEKNSYEQPTVGPGLRDWLDRLPAGTRAAAAFDTRIDASPVLTGSAAKGIARHLSRRGYHLVVPRESFVVNKENRLAAGELNRAETWGAALAIEFAAHPVGV
jgi:hypothetical protein